MDYKNEQKYLEIKRRAVLENILADTKMKEAQAAGAQKFQEAQIVFKQNQILQQRLLQAKLEKIQPGLGELPQEEPRISSADDELPRMVPQSSSVDDDVWDQMGNADVRGQFSSSVLSSALDHSVCKFGFF